MSNADELPFPVRIEDLVVLAYSDINRLYTQVISAKDAQERYGEHFWTDGLSWKTYDRRVWPIGRNRYTPDRREGEIIGVYDRTNTQQLGAMVSAGIEATKERGSLLDD